MQCEKCGRELREDSKFCDFCGNIVEKKQHEQSVSTFNINALIIGILISIIITVIISGTARIFGLPIFFGGLFLPLFWHRIKKG